jgi:hypothetical protein
MGWLYMQSFKGHSGPRQYLDAQFTFERPEATSKVLRSALVGMRASTTPPWNRYAPRPASARSGR